MIVRQLTISNGGLLLNEPRQIATLQNDMRPFIERPEENADVQSRMHHILRCLARLHVRERPAIHRVGRSSCRALAHHEDDGPRAGGGISSEPQCCRGGWRGTAKNLEGPLSWRRGTRQRLIGLGKQCPEGRTAMGPRSG